MNTRMKLLMPRPRPPGDDQTRPPPSPRPPVSARAHVPTGEHIPQAWRGIGRPPGARRPPGTVYGRTPRQRACRRLGWVALTIALLIAAVAVAGLAALLQILVL